MTRLTVTKSGKCLLWMGLVWMSGCAALHPVPGVPARYLAPELRAVSRSNESTIDLSLLAQTPPPQHLVDGGDVLGIYIEGVLGNPGEAPPITVPTSPDLPPSIGYPITVRDDGTLSLPLLGSIDVRGLTIRQVEEKLRHLYTTEKQILRPGQDRIIVSLQRPRQVRVLVLRQETGGPGGNEFAQGLSINLGQTKRGNGQAVDLPIYKNDVLHALARTGGLPGLDAENTIYIVRRQAGHTAGNCLPAAVQGNYGSPQPVPRTNLHQSSSQTPVTYRSQNPQQIQQVGYQQNRPLPSRNPYQTIEQATYHSVQTENSSTPYEQQQVPQGLPQQSRTPHNPPVMQATAQTRPSAGQTIKPVQVRNFSSGNPLNELRSGMDQIEQSTQEVSLREETMPAPLQSPPSATPVPLQTPGFYPDSQSSAGQVPPGSVIQLPPMNASPYAQPVQPLMTQPALPVYPTPGPEYAPAYMGNGIPMYQQEMPLSQELSGDVWNQLPFDPAMLDGGDPTINNRNVIKIPVRLRPGQQPDIKPSDVILQEGDIVFIESRETEIFYTGGLLGGGQFTLPRDYDLDVLGAISIAQGANQQQAGRQLGGVSAINGDVTISASDVIILRQTPNGSQVPIKVDLYRAINDPAERVLIKPGDIVMLRYKPLEAVGAFIERNLLESALFGLAASQLPSSN